MDKKNNSCSTTEKSNNSSEIIEPVVVNAVNERIGHKKRLVQTKTKHFFQTNNKPKNGIETCKVHSPPVQVVERSTEDSSGSVNTSKTPDIVKTKRTTKKDKMNIFSPKESATLVPKRKKLRLSRKHEQSTEELSVEHKKTEQPQSSNLKKMNSMDIFQVMMDNRKKSIGMNSSGQEIVCEDDPKEVSDLREIKAKRSLSLSKWADLKGAGKKREVEELHEEHVKKVLDKRAKSFKSMLLKDTHLKEKKSKIIKTAKNVIPKVKIVDIEIESSSDDSEVCLAEVQTNQKSKKRIRDSKCDSEDAAVKKTKLQSPKNIFLGSPNKLKKPPFPEENVLDSTPKKIKMSKSFKQSFLDSSSNIEKPPSIEPTFTANLSPPLKKKESMLSYFDKKDDELIEVLYFEDMSENDCDSDNSQIIKVEFKVKSKKCKLKRKSMIRKIEKSIISDELHEITNNKLLTSEGTANLSKVKISTTESKDNLPDLVKEEIDLNFKKVSALGDKRSQSFSKSADLKGAGKKREVEELHEEHVKEVLDKRAKSLKSVLLKDTPLKEKKHKIIKTAKNVTPKAKIVNIEIESSSDDSEVCLAEVQINQKSKMRIGDSKCDSEDAAVKTTKLQSPKNIFLGSPHKLRRPPFPEENVLGSTSKKFKKSKSFKQNFLDSSSNIEKPPSIEPTFTANLSPPLKKKESMLSYFEKKDDKLIKVLCVEDMSENDCDSESSQIIQVKFKVKSKKCKLKRKSKIRKTKKNIISDELHEITNNKLLTCEGTANLSKVNILTTEGKDDLPDLVKEEMDLTEIVISETNGGLRPKRTIRKPIKYVQAPSEDSDSDSEDYEILSKKTKQDKKNDRKMCNNSTNKENLFQIKQNKNFENIVSPIKIVNLQSPGKLQCMRSPRTISLLKRDSAQTEALAPLFRKSIPKPIIDQSVVEARRLFLHSGVPDSIKIQVDKVSAVFTDVNYFPSISHIQQIPGESEPDYLIWRLPMSKYNADSSLLSSNEEQEQTHSQHLFKDFISKSISEKNNKNRSDMFNDLTKLNYKAGLKKLKEGFPDFPVYRTFRKLWGKYNIVPKLSGNDVENGKYNENEPETSIDSPSKNGSLWTEKYKPAVSCDILGNFKSVNSLKKWLECWKEYNELSASKMSKRSRKNSDSSSDFCTSDSESKDSARVPSNMMVVTGPPGSGKTSCVYALANELRINVLEVNASSKRTGRKILTELQEATQSHKVLTKMNSDSSTNGFFNSLGKLNEDNSQKRSNKECKTEKLSKKVALSKNNSERSSQNSFKLSNTEPFSQRSDTNIMSLILIDDADIVFEEDDGFVGALAQLVQSSKRPVLIVASDLNCGHLQRFMTDCNVVHFNPLYGKILGPWLDILVLIECNKIIPNLSRTLLDFNKGDIRSTLLQLQYWVLGSQKRKSNEANEFHLIDENGMSHSPLGDWLDDDSNISWHKSSAKLNQEVEKSHCNVVSKNNKTCEFNLSTLLLSELSQTCNLRSIWINKTNLFSYVQENGDAEIFESSKVILKDANERKSMLKIEQVDLDSLFNLFDCMSAVDMMHSCNKFNTGVKLPWQTELKDSLSESENFTMFQNHRDPSSVWCQYMIDHFSKCAEKTLNLESNQTDPAVLETELSRESEHNTLTHLEFSKAIPCGAQLDRASVALDYMSSLRTMCRTEKQRSKNNFKRNNRFYHYLNSLSSSGKEKFYDNACSILEF